MKTTTSLLLGLLLYPVLLFGAVENLDLLQLSASVEKALLSSKDDLLLEETLKSLGHKEVQLRGFLHQDDKGHCSVASQQSLRSCCLNGKTRAALQVFLDKEFSTEQLKQIVTVKGSLEFSVRRGENKDIEQIMHLKGTEIMLKEKKSLPVASLAFLLGLTVIAATFILRKQKKT
jgi:hypothetical protein